MILSKKTKHIIIVSLDIGLKKTSLQAVFLKNIKTKRQIIMDFSYGLIMKLLHT